jgi:hypothetical protein
MSRPRLLAFKRGPTVDIRLDDLIVEVKENRVLLTVDGLEYLTWEEWSDFVRRVDHAIQWIQEHTPDDVSGSSYEVNVDG